MKILTNQNPERLREFLHDKTLQLAVASAVFLYPRSSLDQSKHLILCSAFIIFIMANEYYRKHKELLKDTRIKFNLQINVDKTQLGELEMIKKQLSKVRECLGLQRGTCKTANLKLMQELLDAWMFLHKDKLDRQAAQDHEMSDAPHTMFPVDGDQELSRVLHSVTFTPSVS